MAPLQTSIIGARNQVEPAIIRKVDLIKDGLSWFIHWFPRMYDLSGEQLFEDSHWDVTKIWGAASNDDRMRAMVLEAADQIQGYVAFQFSDYIGVDGKPCAYVAFLATAPWNRKRKGSEREYKGVGSTLLAITILHELKHIGSLTLELHSLPQSEIFYRKLGMHETGNKSKEGLKQMRLERPDALTLIRPFRSSFMRKEA